MISAAILLQRLADQQLVDAVAAVDVVAEMRDAVAGRPGRDVGEIDRHRLRKLDRRRLAALDRGLEMLAVPARRDLVTWLLRDTQPDESKRISLLNRPCEGVSCI